MKRSERQRRKGKIYPFECRVSKNSKEREESLPHDQCKEIEENNRMGKTRNLFKKIRDTKGTFHAKTGTIKDRISKDLTESDEVNKGCKNAQKNYAKEIFTIQIIMMV